MPLKKGTWVRIKDREPMEQLLNSAREMQSYPSRNAATKYTSRNRFCIVRRHTLRLYRSRHLSEWAGGRPLLAGQGVGAAAIDLRLRILTFPLQYSAVYARRRFPSMASRRSLLIL